MIIRDCQNHYTGQASDQQTEILFNVAQLFIFSVVKFLFLLDKIVSLTRIFESLDFEKTTGKIFNSLNYNLVDLPKEIKNIYQRYL